MLQTISQRLSAVAVGLSDDPRQAPRLARQLGLNALLFDVTSPALDIPELSISGRREFRQILAASAQRLVGLQMDLGPRGLSPSADIDREIARLDRAMETAAGLESPMVCVDLGPLPAPAIVESPRPAIPPSSAGLIIIPESKPTAPLQSTSTPPDPAFVSQLQAALSEIGGHADRYSVMLAFSSSLASFASLSQALAAVRCPWFGVDMDPLALLRDDWDAHQVFSAVGPLIRHFRARDGVCGAEKRIKPAAIGKGDIVWPEMISLLDEAAYQSFITLDPLDPSNRRLAISAAAEYLRALKQ